MRSLLAALLSVPLLLPASAQAQKKSAPGKKPAAKTPLPFKTFRENFSYGYGLYVGQQAYASVAKSLGRAPVTIDRKKLAESMHVSKDLVKAMKRRGVEMNELRMADGFRDAVSGSKARMDFSQLEALFKDADERISAARKVQGEKNKKDGEAFLKVNAKKDGVKTTKSGLQYKVLREGNGKNPALTDYVITHYHGTLLDGTVFDSSVDRKKPFPCLVGGRIIKGWKEALLMMKKGSKWRIFVPADLAYRERGQGDIGPHAVLIFELELLDIREAPKFNPR